MQLRCNVLTRDPLRALKRFPFIEVSDQIKLIGGDITNIKLTENAWDYVIHGATTSADDTFNGISELSKFNLLVDGTRNLMQQLKAATRAVFLSSGAVYLSGDRPIKEDDPNAPETIASYTGLAHGKRAAEFLFNEYCQQKNIDCKIARCFSFVGIGLPTNIHYAISGFIQNAILNDKIIINSDGSMMRSYMDMRDFIVWLGLLLCKTSDHKIYNVGSSIPISILDLARYVCSITRSASNIEVKNLSDTRTGVHQRQFYVPSTSRFVCDYNPNVPIGIEKSISDFANGLKFIAA